MKRDFIRTNIYTRKVNHDSNDLVLGMYINVGLSCDFWDSLGVAVVYRYDQVFDDATTRLVDVNLDGSSTQVKLIYSF